MRRPNSLDIASETGGGLTSCTSRKKKFGLAWSCLYRGRVQTGAKPQPRMRQISANAECAAFAQILDNDRQLQSDQIAIAWRCDLGPDTRRYGASRRALAGDGWSPCNHPLVSTVAAAVGTRVLVRDSGVWRPRGI